MKEISLYYIYSKDDKLLMTAEEGHFCIRSLK
jgi:hypothetical protein